jgi:hypothetical protein
MVNKLTMPKICLPCWVELGQELADTVYLEETPQQSATCSEESVAKKWEREEPCGMACRSRLLQGGRAHDLRSSYLYAAPRDCGRI